MNHHRWITIAGLLVASHMSTAAATTHEPLPVMGLAHVVFQTSNPEASRMFYTGMLGYELAWKEDGPGATYAFKVNDDQFIKLVAVPGTTDDDRLVEVALEVADAGRALNLLREHGLVPTPLETRADGTRATTVRDPDGHRVAFVEYTAASRQAQSRGRHLGLRRASTRLLHTGITVADEARARAFYEEILGGREFWRGGPEGQPPSWVNVRLPGERGDYIEYMLLNGSRPSRERLGSMHHVCFQTDDLRESHRKLGYHGLQDIERHHPRIGRNGYWLCNVSDPDGTRSEFMESRPVAALVPVAAGAEPRYFGAAPGALILAKIRLQRGDPALARARARLVADAVEALQVRPPTVTDKTRPGASGNLHDYATQAPYLWPDPASPTGLPYIPRDGVVNPVARHPDNSDHTRAGLLGRTVSTLALAYYFTGDEAYASHAARCLRVWFIDAATRMRPNMNFAQAVPGRNIGRGIGIIEAGGLVDAVDAAGLLAGSPAWTREDEVGLQAWVGEFLDWLLFSGHGLYEAAMRQNHGTMYDVRVVRLALVAGKDALARQILEAVPTRRIALQIEPDGTQPMELRRTKSFSYSELNLSGLVTLATLGDRFQLDLWGFETVDGRGIRAALDFMFPYIVDPARPWPYEHIVPFDRAAWARTYREAAIGFRDTRYEAVPVCFPECTDARFQLLAPVSRPGETAAGHQRNVVP